MFEQWAEYYKLTEKDLTRKSLRRLWILAFFGLPFPFSMIFWGFFTLPQMKIVLGIIILISGICFMVLACSKFMNRFWQFDKYLDEWERERKHAAHSFTLQCVFLIMGIVMLAMVIWDIILGGKYFVVQFELHTSDFLLTFVGLYLLMMYIHLFYLLGTVKPIDADDIPRTRNRLILNKIQPIEGVWGFIGFLVLALIFVGAIYIRHTGG